jgi:hypothetical protein
MGSLLYSSKAAAGACTHTRSGAAKFGGPDLMTEII